VRFRRIPIFAVLSFAALLIAGCGGGDGDDSSASAPAVATTPTAPTLSKEELIAQGDAICAEVNAAIGSVGAGGAEPTSLAGQVADLYTGMVDSLRGLGTPEDTAGYSEFIAAAEELSQAEGEAKLAAERGDEAALATAESDASSALASFQSAAQEYGFEACGEGPSAPIAPAGTAPPSGEAAPVEVPEAEEAAPEEAAPEPAPETGGAGGGGTAEGGGAGGGAEGGGGSGGIGPG